MVSFHIGVNFFGGGTDVEFEVVADVVDVDDDVVVEVGLGIALTAGKPEDLFQSKLEAGAFSFDELLDSEGGWD
jgi:hypothetical protein